MLIAWVVTILGVGAKTIIDLSGTMRPSASVPKPRQQISIVDEQFRVMKGSYWRQRFDILKGWKEVRVLGKFTAAGTTADGVTMFLTDEANLAEFASRGDCPTLYRSGNTMSGQFSQVLDPGSYCVVVANPAPSDSDKAVTATVKVEYSLH